MKPYQMYVIATPDGAHVKFLIHARRKDCIEAFNKWSSINWKEWRKAGWKCVPVMVHSQIICKHAPPESVLPQAQFIDQTAPPAKITIVGKEEADAAFNTVKLREYVESGRRSVAQCAKRFGVTKIAIEMKVNVPDSYMILDEDTGMIRPCRRRGSKRE